MIRLQQTFAERPVSTDTVYIPSLGDKLRPTLKQQSGTFGYPSTGLPTNKPGCASEQTINTDVSNTSRTT
eukprot:scaffold675194_cov60-Prasinocladus_malaysianus.AAC.1